MGASYSRHAWPPDDHARRGRRQCQTMGFLAEYEASRSDVFTWISRSTMSFGLVERQPRLVTRENASPMISLPASSAWICPSWRSPPLASESYVLACASVASAASIYVLSA